MAVDTNEGHEPVSTSKLIYTIPRLPLKVMVQTFRSSSCSLLKLEPKPLVSDRARIGDLAWPPGVMATRLTTNQEIAGSTPAVVNAKGRSYDHLVFFLPCSSVVLSQTDIATRSDRSYSLPDHHC